MFILRNGLGILFGGRYFFDVQMCLSAKGIFYYNVVEKITQLFAEGQIVEQIYKINTERSRLGRFLSDIAIVMLLSQPRAVSDTDW